MLMVELSEDRLRAEAEAKAKTGDAAKQSKKFCRFKREVHEKLTSHNKTMWVNALLFMPHEQNFPPNYVSMYMYVTCVQCCWQQ